MASHDFNEVGWCVWCGAAHWDKVRAWHQQRNALSSLPEADPRSCTGPRGPKPMPEPARRKLAHEDADTICARIAELRAESEFASIARHCAAMLGQPKGNCHQCGPGVSCRVCARARSKPIAECPLCWHTPAKPCPT